jgi:hypothetical protein
MCPQWGIQMVDRIFRWTCVAILWACVITLNVWMTKAGAPQQVWFFCKTLHWCSVDVGGEKL